MAKRAGHVEEDVFLDIRIPRKGGVVHNVVRSILKKLDELVPLSHGNGEVLSRELQSRHVSPDDARRAHNYLVRLPRRSPLRSELHDTLRPHRERLWSAFLTMLSPSEREKYEPQEPIRSARFPQRHTPARFSDGDDRKKGR